MNDFCPYINGGCKGKVCKLWFEPLNDCLETIYLGHRAEYIHKYREHKKTGLDRVHKEIGKVITKGFLSDIAQDGNLSDNDRQLLIKLTGEKERLEQTENLEELLL